MEMKAFAQISLLYLLGIIPEGYKYGMEGDAQEPKTPYPQRP